MTEYEDLQDFLEERIFQEMDEQGIEAFEIGEVLVTGSDYDEAAIDISLIVDEHESENLDVVSLREAIRDVAADHGFNCPIHISISTDDLEDTDGSLDGQERFEEDEDVEKLEYGMTEHDLDDEDDASMKDDDDAIDRFEEDMEEFKLDETDVDHDYEATEEDFEDLEELDNENE